MKVRFMRVFFCGGNSAEAVVNFELFFVFFFCFVVSFVCFIFRCLVREMYVFVCVYLFLLFSFTCLLYLYARGIQPFLLFIPSPFPIYSPYPFLPCLLPHYLLTPYLNFPSPLVHTPFPLLPTSTPSLTHSAISYPSCPLSYSSHSPSLTHSYHLFP